MSDKNAVRTVLENVKDTASEARHRVAAKTEELRREVGKGVMKPSDNLGSIANQAKNETQAEIDRAKRDIRNTDKK